MCITDILIKFVTPFLAVCLGASLAFILQNKRERKKEQNLNHLSLLQTWFLINSRFSFLEVFAQDYLSKERSNIVANFHNKIIYIPPKEEKISISSITFITNEYDKRLSGEVIYSIGIHESNFFNFIDALKTRNISIDNVSRQSDSDLRDISGDIDRQMHKLSIDNTKSLISTWVRSHNDSQECMVKIEAIIKECFPKKYCPIVNRIIKKC